MIGIATTLIVESYLSRTKKSADMGGRRSNFVENEYAPPGEDIGMTIVDDDENSGITL